MSKLRWQDRRRRARSVLARPRELKRREHQRRRALSSPPRRDRREGRRPSHAAPPQGERTPGGRGRANRLARENRDDGTLEGRQVGGRAGCLVVDAQRPARRVGAGAAREKRAAVAGIPRLGGRWVVAAGSGAHLVGCGGGGSGYIVSVAKTEASKRRGRNRGL